MPFTNIKRITVLEEREPLVDVTVEDNHNFILGSGICVSNSAMIDLNVLRLADVVLLKEPSLLQAKFERKAIKDMYNQVGDAFKQLKHRERYFYVWSDEFEGMMEFELPDFWNESISKSFGKT